MDDFNYLRGVYIIAPTPFGSDGTLDESSVGKFTDFAIEKGVDGITILGVMGETGKVSEHERERIIASFLEAADGRVPICVGTTHAATGRCVAFSVQAQEMGAKAFMVAPPRLSRSNDSALRRHYAAVADATSLPIIVQDHPPSSGVFMSVEFLAAIAREIPQCRFIKLEDEPSPQKISKLLRLESNLRVFGGLGGNMFLEELRHGAVGTMTGFAYCEILVEIYRKFVAGDLDGATEVFYRYSPLIRFENQAGIALALRKHVYNMRGVIASPTVREPFMPLEEDTIDDLKDLLKRLHLL